MEDRHIQVTIKKTVDGASLAPDCVVWNAGAAKCHSLKDMPDEDYKIYVCVEPGSVWGKQSVASSSVMALSQLIKVDEISFVCLKHTTSPYTFSPWPLSSCPCPLPIPSPALPAPPRVSSIARSLRGASPRHRFP